ncbi:NUAK family SNF1-like kinase 1 isoform X2 [Corticium candelabrum]|nr:NUAK family SNF1-like kinase 1 isoform X2 [Corticium candelabrum]
MSVISGCSTSSTGSTGRGHTIGHYRIVRTLGSGTYGKVKLAEDLNTGKKVALKLIEKSSIKNEKEMQRVRREVAIQSALRHPHIVEIFEVMEDKQRIILAMEYVSGGELFDYIATKKTLSETEARRTFRQVVAAVHYCHENGVTHRDLKLENILLDEDKNVKIIDFGLSNTFSPDAYLSTYCGSPLYAAPEMIRGIKYVGPEVDCWSLGVLLYTLVCGTMPFDDRDPRNLVRCVSSGTFHIPRRMPTGVRRLVKHMLSPNPDHRANIEDINRHPWLSEGYDDTPSEEVKPKLLALASKASMTRFASRTSLNRHRTLSLQHSAPHPPTTGCPNPVNRRRFSDQKHPALGGMSVNRDWLSMSSPESSPVRMPKLLSPVHQRILKLQHESISESSSDESTGSSAANLSNSSLFYKVNRPRVESTQSTDSGYAEHLEDVKTEILSAIRKPDVDDSELNVDNRSTVLSTVSIQSDKKGRTRLTDRVVRKLFGQLLKGSDILTKAN